MASSSSASGGVSTCSLITVLFVGLKLCGKIDWSWWWVLSPLWLPFALAFAVMGFIGTLIVIGKVIKRATK